MPKPISLSEVLRILAQEEPKAKPAPKPKATKVFEQLALTMKELDKELARSESSDTRLEYFFNKLKVLETYL